MCTGIEPTSGLVSSQLLSSPKTKLVVVFTVMFINVFKLHKSPSKCFTGPGLQKLFKYTKDGITFHYRDML